MLCTHLAESTAGSPRVGQNAIWSTLMVEFPHRDPATHGSPLRGCGSLPDQLLLWRFIEPVLCGKTQNWIKFHKRKPFFFLFLTSVMVQLSQQQKNSSCLTSFLKSRLFHVWQQLSKGKQVERNLTCFALNRECGEIMPSGRTCSNSLRRTDENGLLWPPAGVVQRFTQNSELQLPCSTPDK